MLNADQFERTAENIAYALRQSQTERALFSVLAGNDGAFLIEAIECIADVDRVTGDNGGFHFIDCGLRLVREEGERLDELTFGSGHFP